MNKIKHFLSVSLSLSSPPLSPPLLRAPYKAATADLVHQKNTQLHTRRAEKKRVKEKEGRSERRVEVRVFTVSWTSFDGAVGAFLAGSSRVRGTWNRVTFSLHIRGLFWDGRKVLALLLCFFCFVLFLCGQCQRRVSRSLELSGADATRASSGTRRAAAGAVHALKRKINQRPPQSWSNEAIAIAVVRVCCFLLIWVLFL